MSQKTSVKCWPLKRTIFLGGDIRGISATLLEEALARIPRKRSRRPFYLIIDSEGGDFYAMLKMRGLLKKYERSLITVVYGKAYSGALTLLQSGARRLMTKRSVLRFHQANHNFMKATTLNATSMSSLVRQLEAIDAMQKLIYMERADPTTTPLFKKFQMLFEKEAYLRYPQAKNIHLVDAVIPEPKSLEALIEHLLTFEPDAFLETLRRLSKFY